MVPWVPLVPGPFGPYGPWSLWSLWPLVPMAPGTWGPLVPGSPGYRKSFLAPGGGHTTYEPVSLWGDIRRTGEPLGGPNLGFLSSLRGTK